MNQGGRILLLTAAVILLVVGVVCLKRRVGDSNAPPVTIPGSDLSSDKHNHGVTRQPTILSADPNSESGPANRAPWRANDPLPASELDTSNTPTYPVNNLVPPPTDSTFRAPADSPRSNPAPAELEREFTPETNTAFRERLDRTEGRGSRVDSLPQTVATDVPTEVPTQFVTQQDDSLWQISERIYGDGLFYKALYRHNRDRIDRPDRISAGTELSTPSADELRRLYPSLCPTVRPAKM